MAHDRARGVTVLLGGSGYKDYSGAGPRECLDITFVVERVGHGCQIAKEVLA